MLELFWELRQQRQLGEAEESARSASSQARDASYKVAQLESQIDKLTLTCAALWTLLKKSGYQDADLEAAIREADLSDGRLDGKINTPATDCPKCGRTISKRHNRCLYCGDTRSDDPFQNL